MAASHRLTALVLATGLAVICGSIEMALGFAVATIFAGMRA